MSTCLLGGTKETESALYRIEVIRTAYTNSPTWPWLNSRCTILDGVPRQTVRVEEIRVSSVSKAPRLEVTADHLSCSAYHQTNWLIRQVH